jgi:hypothetical protein
MPRGARLGLQYARGMMYPVIRASYPVHLEVMKLTAEFRIPGMPEINAPLHYSYPGDFLN